MRRNGDVKKRSGSCSNLRRPASSPAGRTDNKESECSHRRPLPTRNWFRRQIEDDLNYSIEAIHERAVTITTVLEAIQRAAPRILRRHYE
jgi:hypothetical protein